MILLALVAIIAIAGAGCDNLFGLPHIAQGTPPADSRLIDGRSIDAPSDASADANSDLDAFVPDAFVPLGCPAGYAQNGTSAYRFVNLPATWVVAAADCADDTPAANDKHTHLAVATNDQELGLFYFTIAGSAGDLWIGLSDRVMQNRFEWVSAEPLMYPPAAGSPWGAGEPSAGTGDDCVVEHSGTTELDATLCASAFFYVCECDDYPDVPANYEP